MSLNLFYSFREGFLGLRRARLASTITISTVAITLTLFGFFLLLTLNVLKIDDIIKKQMSLEIFINEPIGQDGIKLIESQLSKNEEIDQIKFISKEMALEIFRNELGMDPLQFLIENPLPPSFRVSIKKGYRISKVIDDLSNRIENIPGVDKVIYHGRLFAKVERYSRILLAVDFGLLILVLLSVIFLVANTLRLTILAQGRTIQIMELVGATRGFIQRPYIIQGVLQGSIGGIIGSGVVWILVKLISLRFSYLLDLPAFLYFLPFLLGMMLGFIGSILGLKKFLKI